MVGVIREEQAIWHAQHLDLIYSWLGTLYEIIPNSPLSSYDVVKSTPKPHANGMVGSISTVPIG